MITTDIRQLAQAWIKLQGLPRDTPEADALSWVIFDLGTLVFERPEESWNVILEIFRSTDDEWVLTNLAAGPIEDLLALHGEMTIGWIEQEAKSNAQFRRLLDGVWRNLIPEQVWSRLESIRK